MAAMSKCLNGKPFRRQHAWIEVQRARRTATSLRRGGPGGTTVLSRCGSHVGRPTWEPHRDSTGWTPLSRP
jgi:hypothetical protein